MVEGQVIGNVDKKFIIMKLDPDKKVVTEDLID